MRLAAGSRARQGCGSVGGQAETKPRMGPGSWVWSLAPSRQAMRSEPAPGPWAHQRGQKSLKCPPELAPGMGTQAACLVFSLQRDKGMASSLGCL